MGRMIDGVWVGVDQEMREFEQETWGTNDLGEIKENIIAEAWSDAQDRLTGMDAEQADWDEGEDEEDDCDDDDF